MATSPNERQTVPLAEAIALGRQRHAAGALDEAQHIYHSVLRAVPDHPEPLALLASIAFRRGRDAEAAQLSDRAIESYERALAQNPGDPMVRGPMANLFMACDRVAEAEALIDGLELPLNPMRSDRETFADRRRAAGARGLPAMLINSVPKAASESIWNHLAAGLGLPQSHVSLGLFPASCAVPARVREAVAGGVIAKEHLTPTPYNLRALAEGGMGRVVVHVRDPRQATLSWAHFVRDDVGGRLMAPLWRRSMPPAAVLAEPLSRQLDWYLEHYLPLQVTFVEGWIDAAATLQVRFLTFERYLADPAGYAAEVLNFYGIDPALWDTAAKGDVINLRKGESEEWRSVYTDAQAARAWDLIPGRLAERFGWSR